MIAMLALGYVEAHACFDPMDRYSIEIVLNKPGVTYNLSALEKMVKQRLVTKIEPEFKGISVAYLYRSHVDKHIVMIVSLQSVPIASDVGSWRRYFIAIRLEPEAEYRAVEEHLFTYYTKARIPAEVLEKLPQLVEEVEKIGWRAESKSGTDAVVLDLSKEVNGLSIKIGMGISYSTKSGNLRISIVLLAKEVTDPEEAKEVLARSRVLEEIEKVLRLFGMNYKLSIDELEYSYVKTDGLYVPKVDPELLKKALVYELKWLRSIGVVNISDRDIEELEKVAKPGYAGWNSRIIYTRERGWIPYAELGTEAMLIRSAGCLIPFNSSAIPEKPPSLTATTTGFPLTTITVTKTVYAGGPPVMVWSTTTITKEVTTTTSRFPEPASLVLGLSIGFGLTIPVILALSRPGLRDTKKSARE